MPSQDMVTWNAILGGCAMHGHGKEALKHFEQMCEEGVQPDDSTFVCLLSACINAGLVDEGMGCLCFNDHRLYDCYKIGTLDLHEQPSWLCWPSTGGREYDQGNAL